MKLVLGKSYGFLLNNNLRKENKSHQNRISSSFISKELRKRDRETAKSYDLWNFYVCAPNVIYKYSHIGISSSQQQISGVKLICWIINKKAIFSFLSEFPSSLSNLLAFCCFHDKTKYRKNQDYTFLEQDIDISVPMDLRECVLL